MTCVWGIIVMMAINSMTMGDTSGWVVHRPREWESLVLLGGTGQDGSEDGDTGEDLRRRSRLVRVSGEVAR